MSDEQQLEWEARAGKPAAASAIAAVVLALVGTIFPLIALSSHPQNRVELMSSYDQEPTVFYVGAAISALGTIAIIPVLLYLFRVISARRPDFPRYVLPLLILGPALIGVANLLGIHDLVDNAREFLASGKRTDDRARDLQAHRTAGTLGLGLGGGLAFAYAVIVTSLGSMRTGILSRFMGVLGIGTVVLLVLGSLAGGGGPAQFIELFWLAALAVLFLDRWPGGRGPAWSAVEAIPWPRAAQQRDQGADDAAAAGSVPDAPVQPAARKRKRKSRKR